MINIITVCIIIIISILLGIFVIIHGLDESDDCAKLKLIYMRIVAEMLGNCPDKFNDLLPDNIEGLSCYLCSIDTRLSDILQGFMTL